MVLTRIKASKGAVLGVLKDDVGGTYFTVENADTLLPEGRYDVVMDYSPKFQRKLPHIYNDGYPLSRGFRIHSGNSKANSKGCICVGNTCSLEKMTIGKSAAAIDQLGKCCSDWLVIQSFDNK